MAKKSNISCPMCAWKGDPDGKLMPPHLDDSGAVCVMATRPVPEFEDQGPVTDGSGPAGGDTGTPGGAAGTTTTP